MKINRKTWKYKYITSVLLYLKDTWKNKLAALMLVALGLAPVFIDKDGSFLLIVLFFAVPLFITVDDVFDLSR